MFTGWSTHDFIPSLVVEVASPTAVLAAAVLAIEEEEEEEEPRMTGSANTHDGVAGGWAAGCINPS
jgi:hypothetical protein